MTKESRAAVRRATPNGLSGWLEAHLRSAVAMGIVAVVGACGLLPPDDALDVTITLSDTVLVTGAEIDVTVEVINRGTSTKVINTNDCPRPFTVVDNDGVLVGPAYGVCLAFAAPRSLSPGDALRFDTKWAGHGIEGGLDGPQLLPTGAYDLVGHVGSRSLGLVRSSPVTVRLAR